MTSSTRIRVGVIGANGQGRWGSRAHVPAFLALPEMDVVAVCTAHKETAESAARHFNVPRFYWDYHAMLEDPNIDLVSIATKVPLHYPMALAALQAGKHVFCEWPLALSASQADELARTAQERRLHHGVDLQSRGSPPILHLKELCDEGYMGRLLTFNMSIMLPTHITPRASHRRWTMEEGGGGNALTIQGGHSIDILGWCLGDIVEVCAEVATRVPEVSLSDTGEVVKVTSPDTIAFVCKLVNGAFGAVQSSWVAWHGSGWRMEAYGTEGKLMATSRETLQYGDVRVRGARKDEPAEHDIETPDRLRWVSEIPPTDFVPYNVAQLARKMAEGIIQGHPTHPNFYDAAHLHRVLEAVTRSARERRWVTVE
ncbi:MAG: Gfo/Idh/MocA family oxidoreductase [Dehalococcoidia bacterium]|nr:Gfo/Idh/MocA family oxidoreductase [Dehalococcoidia bacterium]